MRSVDQLPTLHTPESPGCLRRVFARGPRGARGVAASRVARLTKASALSILSHSRALLNSERCDVHSSRSLRMKLKRALPAPPAPSKHAAAVMSEMTEVRREFRLDAVVTLADATQILRALDGAPAAAAEAQQRQQQQQGRAPPLLGRALGGKA